MTNNAEVCLLCAASPVEGHHLSGRGPNGGYLDPKLTIPLCGQCHQLIGADNRAERIETPAGRPWSFLDAVEWWLKRAALFVARACEFHDAAWLVALADSLRRNADCLGTQRLIFDARYPGWRNATHPFNPKGSPT